jgi:BirA family transcriptional regulator, biotin operon repressor / biotin---[acetyl-CoA-carboxylase] ligase
VLCRAPGRYPVSVAPQLWRPRGAAGGPARRPSLDVVTSAYGDLSRPPLAVAPLRAALVREGGWRALDVVAATGSTNADLASRARDGEAEGAVLVAELQTGGRGRLDRGWTSPARAGLTFSVLLRPRADAASWGWLPLLTGLAVARAVRQTCGLPAVVKWPNDVLVEGEGGLGIVAARKLAGVLAEVPAPGVAVVGVGLNVSTRRSELPVDTATSLALEGAATTDRDTVLRAVLRALAAAYASWQADPDGIRAAYREACDTLGRRVEARLPGAGRLGGEATGVDDDGRLLVWDGERETALAAGDVVHVRGGESADGG